MNFGGILAGGSGTRMGKTDLPKQFLSLGQKPIIIHTIEQFLISTNIDEIVVAVPQNWISYTEDIINRYCRPFITQRIIKENIEMCKEYGAADTVIPATDTIVHAKYGQFISDIPVRSEMYQGQTPQTFKVNEFINVYNSLSEGEKTILTDATKVYVMREKKVALVEGESYNIKITTKYDLKMANLMINNMNEE